MQIRKCALIEMFSLVLIGMFSPFFHIIGSRIGAFGLFPFGNVLTCHVSLQFWRDTHQRAHGRLRRAGGAAWMDPSREHFAARIPDPRPQLAPDSQGRARQLRAAECNLAGPGSVRQQCAAEACPAAARVRTHRLRTQARAARTGLDESGAERGGAAAQRTQRERRGPGQQARLGRRARRG